MIVESNLYTAALVLANVSLYYLVFVTVFDGLRDGCLGAVNFLGLVYWSKNVSCNCYRLEDLTGLVVYVRWTKSEK